MKHTKDENETATIDEMDSYCYFNHPHVGRSQSGKP